VRGVNTAAARAQRCLRERVLRGYDITRALRMLTTIRRALLSNMFTIWRMTRVFARAESVTRLLDIAACVSPRLYDICRYIAFIDASFFSVADDAFFLDAAKAFFSARPFCHAMFSVATTPLRFARHACRLFWRRVSALIILFCAR